MGNKTPKLNKRNRKKIERIIEENIDNVQRHVKSLINRENFPEIYSEDFHSVALIALFQCSMRYDPERKEAFLAYVKQRVNGAIKDYLRLIDPLSRNHRTALKKLRDIEEKYVLKGKNPNTNREYRTLRNKYQAVTFYLIDEQFKDTYRESITSADELLIHRERSDILYGTIKELKPEHRNVLNLHYYAGLKMEEISKVFKLTPSRISQLHSDAIKELRNNIPLEYLLDTVDR